MKSIRFLVVLALFLALMPTFAQTDIEKAFGRASELNDRQEYLKAAEEFQNVQRMALEAQDYGWYLNSLTAEGECYYMLNLVSNLEGAYQKAKQAYQQYSRPVSDSTRWMWLEAVSKLEGAYYYCLCDLNGGNMFPSERAYKRCLNLIDSLKSNTLFDDEDMETVVHRELLSLYYKMMEFMPEWKEKALKEAEKVYVHYLDIGYAEGSATPAQQRQNNGFVDAVVSYAIVQARSNAFDEALNALEALPKSCYNIPSVPRTKGKILMMQYDQTGIDRRAEAQACYAQYLSLQKQRLHSQLDNMSEVQREQYWLNLHDFLFDCYRLGDYAPEMLYDLALFSKGYLLEYNRNRQAKEYTWKDIRKHLDEESCAIEFVQYNSKGYARDLAAIVVTKHCKKPLFVRIVDIDSLKKHPTSGSTVGYTLARPTTSTINALYSDPELPKLIWTDRLTEAIGDARKVYFAADGMLQQLAIEYLVVDSTRSYRRLTSTRELTKPQTPANSKRMLLFGGIDYSALPALNGEGNDAQAYTFLKSQLDAWVDLPGTQAEIDTIARIRHNEQDLILEGRAATDSAFLELVNHYPVVHIATHGIFAGMLEDGTDLKTLLNDNSMSQSGLVFAGANAALSDSAFNIRHPDGFLSARELANTPMDSIELIVLSACQTGLGIITADGVYGIQRALKQAGVKAMIVSLWTVSDEATSLWMQFFYRNLLSAPEMGIHDAFMDARQKLIAIVDTDSLTGEQIHPYADAKYSNAFILIDVK